MKFEAALASLTALPGVHSAAILDEEGNTVAISGSASEAERVRWTMLAHDLPARLAKYEKENVDRILLLTGKTASVIVRFDRLIFATNADIECNLGMLETAALKLRGVLQNTSAPVTQR